MNIPVRAKAFDQLTGCGLETQIKRGKQQHGFLIRNLCRYQDMFNFLHRDQKRFLGMKEGLGLQRVSGERFKGFTAKQ